MDRKRSRSQERGGDGGDMDRRGRDSKSKGDRHRRHSSRDRSSSKRHKKEDRRRGDKYDNRSSNSDATSVSSSSSRSSGKHHSKKKKHRKEKKSKKKHKKKKDRKHDRKSSRKESKKSRHSSRSRSPSHSPATTTAAIAAPPGAHELATALTQLFHSHPSMSFLDEGGIPLLFIQLGRGTEYNLSQMPDRNLAQLLGYVFESLKVHGMELASNGAWKWGNAMVNSGGKQRGDELALLRLTRALLNGVGFTMDKVESYEEGQLQQMKQLQQEAQLQEKANRKESAPTAENNNGTKTAQEDEKDVRHRKRVERMSSTILDRFDPKNSSTSESSLANELQGICSVLMEGESVQLDGIENAKLRATLAQLFQLIGLDLVEIEDEEDDEGDEVEQGGYGANSDEKEMGYALPDVDDIRERVSSNLNEVLRVCRFRSSGGTENAPKAWAAKPTMNKGKEESSSDDDDDGPAPLGTIAAAKASKRKRLLSQVRNNATAGAIDEGGREEWMMVPGEHDFLSGIKAGSEKSTRSRTFKNERNRGQSIAAQANQPINPQVLEEVTAIQKAYEQSRGPSLFDAHRQTVQEEKERQQASGKQDWKWSRDKNLDDGRRVDKNALHSVMGGASTELKSKFHGSLH